MRKSTSAELELRVKTACKLLIEGKSREEIVQYSTKKWRVGERQADKYIQKAKEIIATTVKREVEYDYSRAIMRYDDLYKRALEKGDYRTAMSINKEMTLLQGLYKSQVEHSGAVQFISNIPD